MIVCRTEHDISEDMKEKLALFCDVEKDAVIEVKDVDTLYEVPLLLQSQGFDDYVLDKLRILVPEADMTAWKAMVSKIKNLSQTVCIALVGKYVELPDAYLSVAEALNHAGIAHDAEVRIRWINSETLHADNIDECLQDVNGILVPGGFGDRGIDGKIEAIRFAREQKIPFLGICLGMQLACVEFGRNVLGLQGAHSSEFEPFTRYPIIDLLPEQKEVKEMGGTMRLGVSPCQLVVGSKAYQAYQKELIYERHRHRYEFNNEYRKMFEESGLRFSGTSPDKRLVEVIELENHPWFVASQFHPEFTSRPDRPQPLFHGFIRASLDHQAGL